MVHIKAGAFAYCTNLTTINGTLRRGTDQIEDGAFFGCPLDKRSRNMIAKINPRAFDSPFTADGADDDDPIIEDDDSGCAHGKGKSTYSNGDVYAGQWEDGKKHGEGMRTYGPLADDRAGQTWAQEWCRGRLVRETLVPPTERTAAEHKAAGLSTSEETVEKFGITGGNALKAEEAVKKTDELVKKALEAAKKARDKALEAAKKARDKELEKKKHDDAEAAMAALLEEIDTENANKEAKRNRAKKKKNRRKSRNAGDPDDLPEDHKVPDDPSDDFMCPITCDLMVDPVVASDGHTYERRAIEAWFARCGERPTSPKSGNALESSVVFPNHLIRRQIAECKGCA